MTALTELGALLSSLPGYSLLTDDMKNRALEGALIPDADLVWPGEPDYVATYDVYFAAVNLLGFLMAQPVVRQTSSEGTSVAVDAPNWSGLAVWYRSMSPILQATSQDVLQSIVIPHTPHVFRTDMSGRYDGNDNVDTDLA